jgi:Rod binding domain-containing protein
MNTISAAALPISSTPNEAKPKNAKEAATQFEALLIAQMLRSARESGAEEDSTASTMFDVAGQQFAKMLSENGGLGLAKVIAKGL